MGVDHVCYLIIGRMCTPEESQAIWEQLPNHRDDETNEGFADFESASAETSTFTVVDVDGKTKWPVVVFTYGGLYEDYWDRQREQYHMYVVEKVLYKRSDRWEKEDFEPIQDQLEPHDPRCGLLMILDLQ